MQNKSRTVLITGAGSGFGKLTAATLLRRGFYVFAGMRDPEARDAQAVLDLTRTVRECAAALDVVALDVSRDDSVEAALSSVRAHTDRLDVVVNNAGISAMGLNEGFSTAQASTLLEVNALGAHRVNRAALPLMKPHKSGLLVHVSTGLARMTLPCFGLYSASKAALEAIAESYRYELSGLSIDSVILQPAAYPTNLGASALTPADADRLAEYGALAELPKRMLEGLSSLFAGPNAPNPQDAPDAIVRLIETPAGERPLRTSVGGGGGAGLDQVNELTDRLQAALFDAQGMSELLRIRKR